NRKKTDSTSSTATRIQLIRFCFFDTMLLSLLVLSQYILDNGQNDYEYGKYNGHCGRKSHLPVHSTCLVNVVHDGVGGVVRSASCHDHGLYQHAERADGDCDEHKHAQGLQLRQCDVLKLLPAAGVVQLRRLVESRVDVLQAAQENDHLVSHALPDAHDGDGGEGLAGAVDKWLGVDAEVCQQGIQDALRAVDLHPQSGDNSQGHDNRHKKSHLKVFLAVRRLVDGQRQHQGADALAGHDDDDKFDCV